MGALALAAFAWLFPQDDFDTDRLYIEQASREFLKRWQDAEGSSDWKTLVELHAYALEHLPRKLMRPDPAENRWVPMPRALARKLTVMPRADLAPWEHLARQALATARDRAERQAAIDRYAWTLAAHQALMGLGNTDFDEGRTAEAIRTWTRAFEFRPAPELAARIALAHAALGNSAALERIRARSLEGALEVGGRRFDLQDYLESLRPAPAPSPLLRAGSPPTNDLFLGRYDFRLDEGTYGRSYTSIPAWARRGSRDVVVFTNGIRVTALDPSRGEGGSLEGAVHWRFPEGALPVRAMPGTQSSSYPLPFMGAAISGDRVYVTMFSNQPRSRLIGRRPDPFDGPAALRCLDLATGREIWNTDDTAAVMNGQKVPLWDALPFGQRNFCFSGPPIVRDGLLYAGIMTSPRTEREAYVLCLEAATGRLAWSAHLASMPRSLRDPPPSVTTLAESDGQIVAQSNFGVVAGIAAATGTVDWLTRYAPEGTRTFVNAPVFLRDVVCILAQDRDELLVLDRATGRPVPPPASVSDLSWSALYQLVGTAGDWIVMAGASTYALGPGGQRVELPQCEASRHGRATIAGGFLYVPTMTHLMVYDTRTWKLRGAYEWNGGEPGHMLVADSFCASLGNELRLYSSMEGIWKRFPNLDARPAPWESSRQVARIFAANGLKPDAARHYRRAIETLESDPHREAERREMLERLADLSKSKP